MNKTQRVILLLGIAVIVLMGIYPAQAMGVAETPSQEFQFTREQILAELKRRGISPADAMRLSEAPTQDNQFKARAELTRRVAVLANKANAGDSDAMEAMGDIYRFGKGVAQDSLKAIEWYDKAVEADENRIGVMVKIGNAYSTIQGREDDTISWYESAAELHSRTAMLYLCKFYFNRSSTVAKPPAGFILDEAGATDVSDRKAFYWAQKLASTQGPVLFSDINPIAEVGNPWGDSIAEARPQVEAQLILAHFYHKGIGTGKDDTQALTWFEKASSSSTFNSIEQALYNEESYNVESSDTIGPRQVAQLVELAANSGTPRSMSSMGAFFFYGLGDFEQDYKEAAKWCQKAAEQGQAWAQNHLGWMYQFGQGITQDYKEAFKWYQKAAEQGWAYAQYDLAGMYYNGQGVPQDYKEAAKWYSKAAEQGNPLAQYGLAGMYYNGRGVSQDYKEAAKWYSKAAEQGVPSAQSKLGLMYYCGDGVPQDYKEAVKWYAKAAEQGDPSAQVLLAEMYNSGQGIPQDHKEAFKWYAKAAEQYAKTAEQGDPLAQHKLGLMYCYGDGVPQDYKEAVKWFRKAAEQGLAVAQTDIGSMYGRGSGVPQDHKESFKWYAMAAEQGDAGAQNVLGLSYWAGKGVLEDYVEAYKWLLLAAANGEKDAHSHKQDLRPKMTSSQIAEAQRRAKVFQAGESEDPREEKDNSETATEQPIMARGTGFLFASSGLVATNYHVVSGGKTVRVYFPKVDLEFDATVELKDNNNDLVVLRIKDFAYDDIFSQEVPFGVKRSSGVQLGAEVYTLGFPLGELLGKSAKFSDGTVSSLSGLLGSANLFQINNPIQPGNSGGPLFDGDGNLIGIVVAMLDAKFFYENLDTIPQNVNFAIKADYLINLISMLPEGPSILSRKGSLEDKPKQEQVGSLVPYIVTVRVR